MPVTHLTLTGAIIGDGDRKRTPFLDWDWSHDMGQFFYRLRHTHVHAARIFADVAQEKWRPKFPKSFYAFQFWPTTQRLYGCFRRKLPQFE